jgi:hypothetical protein
MYETSYIVYPVCELAFKAREVSVLCVISEDKRIKLGDRKNNCAEISDRART